MNSNAHHHMKLGHAHLKVRDLQCATAFYTEFLGLSVTEMVGDQYAFLSDGSRHHAIALQRIGADAPTPGRFSTGLYHVAFEVADKSAFALAWRKLRDAGVQVSPVDHLISWAMYFTDPDGNGLEIYVDTRLEPDGASLWNGVNMKLDEKIGITFR